VMSGRAVPAVEQSTSRDGPRVDQEDPVLSIRDLRVEFSSPDGVVHAVNGISLDVRAGKTLAIVGESGSGKSATLLSVLGLIGGSAADVKSGEAILRGGRDLLTMSKKDLQHVRGREIGMVFQNPMTSLNPVFTVGNQVVEAIRVHNPDMRNSDIKARALDLMTRTRLPDPARHFRQYPHELSGGMAQRVMISIAIANSPGLLIADEATTALDVTVQKEILALLKSNQIAAGSATVLISHDLGVVAENADEVAVFYAGRVVETGDVGTIFTAPRHPYTVGLMESMPDTRGKRGIRSAIPGRPPSLLNIPSGCPFHPRCFLARGRDLCHTQLPPLRDISVSTGHKAACHFAEELEPYDNRLKVTGDDGDQCSPSPKPLDSAASGSSEDAPLLELKGLVKEYEGKRGGSASKRGNVRAVDGVDLDVYKGETVAIVGESGSGKSTLAKLVMDIVEPTAGVVRFRGSDIALASGAEMRGMRRRIQMVFQDPYSSLNPMMKVSSILEQPFRIHGLGNASERASRVERLLQTVELGQQYGLRRPRFLSGGERQRVGIARALALEPELLVLDEPTAALDVSIQAQILRLLQDIQTGTGVSYVFISHDLAVVRQIADRIAVMRAGKIVEIGTAEQVCEDPSHPYSKRLLAAVPVGHPDLRKANVRRG